MGGEYRQYRNPATSKEKRGDIVFSAGYEPEMGTFTGDVNTGYIGSRRPAECIPVRNSC